MRGGHCPDVAVILCCRGSPDRRVRACPPICDVSLTEAEEGKQGEMKRGLSPRLLRGWGLRGERLRPLCSASFCFLIVAYLLNPSGPQSLLPQGTLQLWWVTKRAEPPNQSQEEGSGWEN